MVVNEENDNTRSKEKRKYLCNEPPDIPTSDQKGVMDEGYDNIIWSSLLHIGDSMNACRKTFESKLALPEERHISIEDVSSFIVRNACQNFSK